MFATDHPSKNSLEPLEARIAPASAIATAKFIPAVVGGATFLHAGEGLGTATENSGTYLLYVEQGNCIVFTTDFNNNGAVDYNEITGIAAGDGLKLISFVNINGDIVTDLKGNGTLSDSDNNASNDDPFLKGDGRVVLNSTIAGITMRSLTINDLTDQNGDGVVDNTDVALRLALSSYSIFGSIYAGKGFGVENDPTSGLVIDDAGRALQSTVFGTNLGLDYFYNFKPTIGFIKTGTATSGEYFDFGNSSKQDTQGLLTNFIPPAGQAGGDIIGVKGATVALAFNIDGLIAGDGGSGARGGNIERVILNDDTAGGYVIEAGNGGRGASGGIGGSIINFQDLASFTGQIVIHSGDGGTGSTGAGGAGGDVSFGTVNVNGGLGVTLGSGGDGFSAGGNGASLSKAVFTTPEGDIPSTRTIISTVHDVAHDPATGLAVSGPVVGRTQALDFNHDGLGDAVFTTQNPDQVVVEFGDGSGFFADPSVTLPGQFNRLYLPSPNAPDAITVGDFNGDGFEDIAVASNDPGNFGGIEVYLAKTEDTNQDGILSKAEDLNHNGKIDFLGFQAPRYSPLPALSKGDSDGGIILAASYSYMRSAVPISAITAGDFNGDGFTDIAVAAIETDQVTLVQRPVVIFMTANIEDGRPTGTFYADVGTKASSIPPQGANPFVPFLFLPAGTSAIIEASAIHEGVSTHDVVFAETYNASKALVTIDNSVPSIAGPASITNANPSVDTDRGTGVNIQPTTPQDFTISDTNGDHIADFTMITANPANFVVASVGTGTGAMTPVIGSAGDNTGADLRPAGTLLKIRPTFDPADDHFDEVVIELGSTPIVPVYILDLFNIADGPAGNNGDANLTGAGGFTSGFVDTTITTIRAMDIWIPFIKGDPTGVQYLTGLPSLFPSALTNGIESLPGFEGFTIPDAEHYVKIQAGNGGDALVGKGGIGGNLGNPAGVKLGTNAQTGAVNPALLDLISITLPANQAFDGEVDLFGGDGGNGFSTGGKGGSVSSISVRYPAASSFHSIVSLTAGDGGFGVAGAGGVGGDLTGNSVQSGEFFTAGNGGNGAIGGAGGSILGNGNVGLFDTEELVNVLHAGSGGNGAKSGGAGGDIVNFQGLFDLAFPGETGGLLQHIAGNGGNAISGPGGRGGNVINSSPALGANNLAGDIILNAGQGGNGRSGGNGGSVLNFIDRPSESDNPAVLAIIAGDGGQGTAGNGGNGGNVAGIQTPSVGKPNPLSDEFLLLPGVTPMPYTFNRFLAGDAGNSAGGTGGNGGSVHDITTSNSDNPFVMVSGAGGNGLFKGGTGGDLKNLSVNLGAESVNKALFIAGAGGSAAAWTPNPLDTVTSNQGNKFFGGRIGRAGNGGNIINLTQSGSIGARVDLIAGNGGDLINYGTVADDALPVGKGGSILNVNVAGNIGNIAPNIPLKSYNDVFGGETLQHFVSVNLRDPLVPGSFDDGAGMVGLVAGAAGRLKEEPNGFTSDNDINYRSLPSFKGINGTVIDLQARNIASMVAGAVERIAAIRVVGGIQITGGGILGKNFDDNIDPAPYRDTDGNAIPEPVLDGQLVDGALVYQQFQPQFPGDQLPPSPRIFQLGQQTKKHT